MRVFSNVLIAASAATLALSSAGMADIEVAQDDGIWDVTAAGEPLSQVLAAIQSEAGFRLVGSDRLIDDNPVTAEISGSLDDVLARLLTGFDYALVYGETPETSGELQRLVLLSGRAGGAPDESQRLAIERLPGAMSEEDGERVSDLLARQVQPLIDAENGTGESGDTATASATVPNAPASGDSASSGGGNDELDPETQAALAEATRRAQQDLQALVNALQAAEDGGNN